MIPFYQPDPRRRPFPPMYRQNFRAPYQGRQEQRFFYPNQYPNQYPSTTSTTSTTQCF